MKTAVLLFEELYFMNMELLLHFLLYLLSYRSEKFAIFQALLSRCGQVRG